MPYKVFEGKHRKIETTPAVMVRFNGNVGKLNLNAALARTLAAANVKFVVVLWDKARNGVALRAASEGAQNAYRVTYSGDKQCVVSANSFLRSVGWNGTEPARILAEWNEKEKMIEFTLPPQRLAQKAESCEQ